MTHTKTTKIALAALLAGLLLALQACGPATQEWSIEQLPLTVATVDGSMFPDCCTGLARLRAVRDAALHPSYELAYSGLQDASKQGFAILEFTFASPQNVSGYQQIAFKLVFERAEDSFDIVMADPVTKVTYHPPRNESREQEFSIPLEFFSVSGLKLDKVKSIGFQVTTNGASADGTLVVSDVRLVRGQGK